MEDEISDKVFYVDFDNITSTIDLKLSDIADSLILVPLETTEESVLGNCSFYISKDYILAMNGLDGIHKFSADGKFKMKLNVGRGPKEIPTSFNSSINESLNIILIEDTFHGNSKFLTYHLIQEEFLEPVKKHISGHWKSFVVEDDSTIIGSVLPQLQKDSIPHAIFTQNFKGDLISSVPGDRKAISMYKGYPIEEYQGVWITKGETQNFFRFLDGDTLFIRNNEKFIPYIVPRFDIQSKYPPIKGPLEKGDRTLGYPKYENSSFSILRDNTVEEIEIVSEDGHRAYWSGSYIFLNKESGGVYRITSYTDDLIDNKQVGQGDRIVFPNTLPNRNLYVVYFPHELKKLTHDNKSNEAFPPEIYKQLKLISDTIKETDNPVLLIGKIKNNITLN